MFRPLACLALTLLLAGPAVAQSAPARGPAALIEKSVKDLAKGNVGAAIKDDVKALRSGPLLIHGNFCGIGGRSGAAPVDALDAACMRHDECTKTGKLPNCACNDRLRLEASDIAQDPATKPDVQAVASATATSMALLICKTGPGTRPAAVEVQPAGRAAPVEVAPVEVAPPVEVVPAR